MNLIDKTQELQDACKILKKQKVIAIDCEFIREKTFFPIPCLIQVGYEDGAFLIDPLAENMDFGDFFALLQNKKVLKVFHSAVRILRFCTTFPVRCRRRFLTPR